MTVDSYRHGISLATFYKWEAKSGRLDVSEVHRPKTLEAKKAKLKRRLTDAMLDDAGLKDLLSKS